MRLVIIESPFAGDEPRNLAYLDRCILDCLARGESPYASHGLLTRALKDGDPAQRLLGINAGFAWRRKAEATVVYEDYGISGGMALGVCDAQIVGHPVERRRIGPNPEVAP